MEEEPLSRRVTRIEAYVEHFPVLSEIQRNLAVLEQRTGNLVTQADLHKTVSTFKGFTITILIGILITLLTQIILGPLPEKIADKYPPRYSESVPAKPKGQGSCW